MITSITFSALRNDEFYGLLSEGLTLAKAITDKEIQKAVTDFEAAIKNLSDFLEASITANAERQARDLDAERNTIYKACRKVANASRSIPDASAAETGALIWKVFDESPSPIRMNQAQSTGALLNIIQGIKKIDEEKLVACGFKEWLDRLEDVNTRYMNADMVRFSERSKREVENCKNLRIACVDAYNVIVGAAYFKAANGSEPCITFLESMDKAVVAKKLQLKIRRERKKKNTPEDNEVVEAENNDTEAAAIESAVENAATNPAANNEAANNAAPTTDKDSSVGVENAA